MNVNGVSTISNVPLTDEAQAQTREIPVNKKPARSRSSSRSKSRSMRPDDSSSTEPDVNLTALGNLTMNFNFNTVNFVVLAITNYIFRSSMLQKLSIKIIGIILYMNQLYVVTMPLVILLTITLHLLPMLRLSLILFSPLFNHFLINF